MQVNPIKPMLKAPGTKRLTLTHGELLSSFALKFNLRHYVTALPDPVTAAEAARAAGNNLFLEQKYSEVWPCMKM